MVIMNFVRGNAGVLKGKAWAPTPFPNLGQAPPRAVGVASYFHVREKMDPQKSTVAWGGLEVFH
jgi:hypothetical protein